MVSAAEQLAANLNFGALAKAEDLKKRINHAKAVRADKVSDKNHRDTRELKDITARRDFDRETRRAQHQQRSGQRTYDREERIRNAEQLRKRIESSKGDRAVKARESVHVSSTRSVRLEIDSSIKDNTKSSHVEDGSMDTSEKHDTGVTKLKEEIVVKPVEAVKPDTMIDASVASPTEHDMGRDGVSVGELPIVD